VPIAALGRTQIHYESAGEGSALVLLHGIGSNSTSWKRQLSELSQDFRVIAWDAPGYGRSSDPPAGPPSMRIYADCLRAFLLSLQLDRIGLLGHSMGGVIAQEFYRVYPDFVNALILADTTCGGGPNEKWEDRLRKIRTMTPAQFAQERAPKLLSEHAPQELIREAVSIMSEVRLRGYEFAAAAMAGADTREVLRRLKVRTLLVWGGEDVITPPWRETPEGARLEILAGAGHLCYVEQAFRFNQVVREFLLDKPAAAG
jgi:pimeloyl-ACP methyl ester carboxylesterase